MLSLLLAIDVAGLFVFFFFLFLLVSSSRLPLFLSFVRDEVFVLERRNTLPPPFDSRRMQLARRSPCPVLSSSYDIVIPLRSRNSFFGNAFYLAFLVPYSCHPFSLSSFIYLRLPRALSFASTFLLEGKALKPFVRSEEDLTES